MRFKRNIEAQKTDKKSMKNFKIKYLKILDKIAE